MPRKGVAIKMSKLRSIGMLILLCLTLMQIACAQNPPAVQRRLYVAVPGIRNELQYGGQGILVLDIDHGHRFVKRLPVATLDARNQPLAIKGICASAVTERLYVSTTADLTCVDLADDHIVWKKTYPGGCDRMSITPDGKTLYVPSLEGAHWNVVDGLSGALVTQIVPQSGAHNTICAPDGRHVYLAGLRSPTLTVAQTATHTAEKTVGPFGGNIRPFTVNGAGTRGYMCVNGLLGFEVADLQAGTVVHRVVVAGFPTGSTKRHGCPSHGIGLTPDEKELWVVDAHNSRIHVFDATATPPRQLQSITLCDQPGWITFGIDGTLAYPSTGDIVDVATHKVVGGLKDEAGCAVQSEKLLEIDFSGSKVRAAGNQFGIGQLR